MNELNNISNEASHHTTGTPKAIAICEAETQAMNCRMREPNTSIGGNFVVNPATRSVAIDHKGQPITVDRILATKPLKSDLLSRRGPGGRSLVYYNGETVSRLLNDIFGFDGWNMNVLKVERICCVQEKDRWQVGYMAHVRVTHRESGTFKEDMGSGDAIDKHMPTAVQNSVKGAITDALKRAARHFGEKLGNSLYSDSFSLNSCPKTLAEALDQCDRIQRDKFQSLEPIRTDHPLNTVSGPTTSLSKPTVPLALQPQHPCMNLPTSKPPMNSCSHKEIDPTFAQANNCALSNKFHQQPSYPQSAPLKQENKRPIGPTSAAPTDAPPSSYGHRNVYKKPKLNPYA